LTQRVVAEGKGTFDIQAFWLAKEGAMSARSKALRAVLCHVPNSAPQGTLCFLNDFIGDGQYSAKADYKKALIQVQYNGRLRED
jgi:hypothetical protein